jgi:hypothetical protein
MKEIIPKFYRSLSDDLFGDKIFFIRFDLSNIIFGNDGGIFFQLEYLIC